MKTTFLILVILLISRASAQWAPAAYGTIDTSMKSKKDFAESKRPDLKPIPVYPLTHPSYLTKDSPLPPRSFNKSRANWRQIIDSTWGPGLPLASKLQIFDGFAKTLTERFDGFLSLGLSWGSWDSIKTDFRSRIDETTSRGSFAAIMSEFARRVRDGHTWAWDTVVMHTPLSPGVPLLDLAPFASAEHFGAVLTALPDSTALVLRTVKNHPLGLEPGDVVLGYEGVRWMNLVGELLNAGLPDNSGGVGASSAELHALIRNVGNNWHLFDTIDIVKHSTRDTLHLSVQPLQGLPATPMMSNEQLEIPGIPFAQYIFGQPPNPYCTFGEIPGAQTGYIHLVAENSPPYSIYVPAPGPTDLAFNEAIQSLWYERGLVIDLRWNIGGWARFDQAFSRMFSQRILPLQDAYRSSAASFDLAPVADRDLYEIPGTPGSIYDRPIAVLIGPTCVSDGDITAHRLRYHPMVRFFGRPTFASLGDNIDIGVQDWQMNCSISDVFHTAQPGCYLNRSTFPVDESVWFTPDDVAKGDDGVLKSALAWITTLTYAHDVALDRLYNRPALDSVCITTVLANPLNHSANLSAIITDPVGAVHDSVLLHNDGCHGDGSAGDSIWGCYVRAPAERGIFIVNMRTEDATAGSFRRLPNVLAFATMGRLSVDSVGFAKGIRNMYGILPMIKNNDTDSAFHNVTVSLVCNDPWARVVSAGSLSVGDVPPGARVPSSSEFLVWCNSSTFPGYIGLEFQLSVNGFPLSIDSVKLVVTGVSETVPLPATFALEQNYPNPFNPTTNIRYTVEGTRGQRSGVSRVLLSVYDLLGREVAVLVNERQTPGEHEVQFDGRRLASGVYFYRLTSGSFVTTRTMTLVR